MSTAERTRELIRQFRVSMLRPLRMSAAKRIRAKATGRFIGITGSSGKSTTTALIAAVLNGQGQVISQVMDNTIGPLIRTIKRSRHADYVVAEMGVGQKGQMAEMASLVQPDVAVVTLVGLEHYSAFRSSEAIAQEKGGLVEAVNPNGFVVLNADDPLVMNMAARTSARVVTFGYASDADYRIVEVGGGFPAGISVLLSSSGRTMEVTAGFFGKHFALPIAAAVATSIELGVSVSSIQQAISTCQPLRLRLSVHRAPDGPIFLADCAKAPLGTLGLAFDALDGVTAPRRRIVLGSISDYRGKRKKAYQQALQSALAVANEVIVVSGPDGLSWLAPQGSSPARCHYFPTTREAASYIAKTAVKDEVILLKGSSSFHLERIFLNLLDDVRCWETACGRRDSCFSCGLYRHDHAAHKGIRRRRSWLGLRRPRPEETQARTPEVP